MDVLAKNLSDLRMFLQSHNDSETLIKSLESCFMSGTPTPDYSLLSKRLSIEEDVVAKVIHDIIKLAANIAELDAKDEEVLDALCGPLNEKLKRFIYNFALSMRVQPYQMTYFTSRQCHPPSVLMYIDSSLKI
ncbi:hypothetical protein KIN20_010178 [Parelaphostrongylus tenuis]|uniref:Uncharacterized protein n=1 Tax=Parelaphostrongylus tenuis TaxID=148309 RepID=A0AAD5M7I0_PARTN|nr:hypothetical protein KIN20_010178 [Parelaphostrongylus tenuis]